MPAQISKTAELIAGYSLQERIGSGGYGEVWRAEAPGGLLKAIKFIYGRFDEERASCELKSLHRIKEVRHPFLLSLERIEVIDGQLVIVTELAEGSLSDRYEACKAEGLPGIPREELLLYLHDAADALDYMCQHFQLQHLDIKPENLLIVGGRVKVADFGLVKDVQDVTVSLLGGMTPIYAAPEVFNGRPSLHSDQYSLAIVYQEMLSGILPFPGKTPAQLTTQHLNGSPRLAPLPPGDRPIIARALDKDFEKRYPNIRRMIEALQAAGDADETPAMEQPVPPKSASTREIFRTVTLSNMEAEGETAAKPQEAEANEAASNLEIETPAEPQIEQAPAASVESAEPDSSTPEESDANRIAEKSLSRASSADIDAQMRDTFNTINSVGQHLEAALPLNPPAAEFENLPAWEQPFTEATLRPTLVIGMGCTAGQVLWKLQHRWREQFGNMEDVPIFQSLFLDTDRQTLDRIASNADAAGRQIESELLPLRKPEDYRDQTDQISRWLGHRWIYNIPRSQNTEGLRPLGRLALIDNADRVNARIRRILKTIASSESRKNTAEKTKMQVSDAEPLVYLIASISGGTGSGMILDVALAVQQALLQEGITSARICGMLMHGTTRHTAEKKLAIANTYACLRELHAYQRRYPGEPAWGIAAAEKGIKLFDDTYFLHLGDELGESQFGAATEKIAEYLHLDTATACRGFFEQCRTTPASADSTESKPAAPWSLRCMGLSRLGFTPDDIPEADIDALCLYLVDHWRQSALETAAQTPVSGSLTATAPRTTTLTGKIEAKPKCRTPKAIFDFENIGGKVEEIVREQVQSDDENALRESLEKAYHAAITVETVGATANRSQKTLEILYTIVRSLNEKTCVAATNAEKPVLLPLRKLAVAEIAAMRTCILEQLDSSENGVLALEKIIADLLLDLGDREREVCQRQGRLREIIAEAEPHLAPESDAGQKTWVRRFFASSKPSRASVSWNDYTQWRQELVVLHGSRYLWHSLHAGLIVLNEQLREMRQVLQNMAHGFEPEETPAESSESTENWAFDNLLKNNWEELLREHQAVLVGKLEHRLRRTVLGSFLGADGSEHSKNISAKTRAESLRSLVRHEVSKLLQEIDLAGLVLSSEEAASDEQTPLEMILEHSMPPRYSDYGGSQRLVVACPANAAWEAIKQKVETATRVVPSIARTSNSEFVFCYETERVPPLRIAAQLLENHGDCREIAAKLHTRIDVSWPRDF